MKGLLKKLLISLCGLFLLAAAMAVAAVFYLESDHARKLIQQQVNRAIPGTLSWEGMRIYPLRGEMVLDRVRLQEPDGREIVFLDRLLLDVAWLPLIDRDLVIERLILTRPKLSLATDSNGALNLVRALAEDDTASVEDKPAAEGSGVPLNVILHSLQLSEASLSLALQKEATDLRLGKLDLEASGNLDERSGRLSIRAAGFEFLSPELQTSLDRIDLQLGLKDGRVDPLILTTGNDAAGIELTGHADRIWDDPLVDLSARLTASLSRVGDLLSVQPELTGDLSGKIRLRGTLEKPRLEGTFDYGGGILYDQAIEGAHLTLALQEQSLIVERFEVLLDGGRAELTGKMDLGKHVADILTSPDFGLQSAAYQARLTAENLRLERFFENDGNWQGPLTGSVTVEGKGLSPLTAAALLTAQIEGGGLTGEWLQHPTDVQIAMTGQLDAGIGTLKTLEASAGPITLSAGGHINFSNDEIGARLTLDAGELGRLIASPELTGVSGRIHIDATAGGTLQAPVFNIGLNGEKFRYQNVTVGDVKVDAGLDQSGVLQVEAFDLRNKESVIHGKGSVRLFENPSSGNPAPPLNLVFDLKNVRPDDFISPSPVDGRINGKLTLSGSLTEPDAALALSAQQVSIKENRVGAIDARAKFSKGTLYLDNLSINNHQSSLTMSGSAALLDPSSLTPLEDPRFDITFVSQGIYLEDIAPTLKGSVTARGDIQGSLSRPRGTAEVAGRRIDLGFQKLDQVSLSLTMDGSRFQIEQLSVLLQGNESIQGNGWIRTDKSFGLDLSSDGISLEKIANGRLGETIAGKLNFDLNGGGTLDRPTLNGKASTKGLRLNGKAVEDADISVTLAEGLLRMEGRLNFGIDGTLDLNKNDFQVAAQFEGTDLAPYFKVVGQPDVAGEITGNIRAVGNLKALDRLDASADIEKVQIDYRQKNLFTASGFRLSFDGNTLTVPSVRLVLPGDSHMDISGNGRMDGPIDFKLDGNIPVSALGLLTEEVSDLTGQITLSGRLKGSADAPELAAEASIAGAGLTLTELGQKIDAIQGKIEITTTEIKLAALEGRIGGGSFRLNGQVALKDYRPGEGRLTFEATAIPIEIPDTLDMLLNSRIEVSGTPESALAKGEIVLIEGSYYKDLDLSLMAGIQSITTRRREIDIRPGPAETPYLERVKLDIAIKNRNPFLVQNNLADLEVHPDLQLRGTLKDPILNGRAKVEAGTVTYGKTVFDIQKGVIDFNNPYRIEPAFDIEGQAQVRDWLITLAIVGTPEALDMRLSSIPPLANSDIASLLLFGKTAQEISGGGGTGSGQSASNMLAELLASTYANDIKEKTGLDVFELQAETDSQTKAERITVTIGKELSERVTLKYAAESKNGEFIQRAIAEYKLLEHLLVSGYQDTSGSFGGSIKYRLEFR